ncbi:e1-E2 ATPase domain-containing protein [Ditylenchus destructor]|uniref:E1-E2 ATPase domain-containing protein n=1 Tax=Ditylenchus destructor TaxID=166010 RepID=A0AAD4QZJ8_9BILA|nr:e1-E2 ATPase domain-containing protein [Ditylenchus destructor]
MTVDSLVESIDTYQRRPPAAHIYAGPFIVVHSIWFFYWNYYLGVQDYWEIGCIITGVLAILQVLTVLFCYWFVGVNCWLNCTRVMDPIKAGVAKVVPRPNHGWTELVPLRRTKLPDGKTQLWLTFQKVQYTFNEDTRRFQALEFDNNKSMKYFQDYKGIQTEEELTETKMEYGNNRMEMIIPQFMDLFIERATAPFFVFQVFCVGLWCLEDMWYYSAFTLFMLVTFEATIVKQQLKNMSEIRNMGNKPYQIYVYRQKRWNKVNSDELVCGDMVSVSRSNDDKSVPCDLLLLRGSCIVDESMLTGESVPQMKESIEEVEKSRYFDPVNDSRLHVINGGTKIVQHSPPAKNEGGIKAPDNGCVCYVIRTGFNTSQGQLLRTIMFGVKRVTANNLETLAFILFLLMFAIAASAYLWIKGSQDESRNKYKLFLECSLILTSVIPPELPIELSLAVNNSLIALQRLGIFCTEPFRIPFAGKIDICCFDKTGTLTTDNLVVEGIAGINSNDDSDDVDVIKSHQDVDPNAIKVLAACQSLVRFDEELVGDPLEKACLKWIDWNVTKQDAVIPKKGAKGLMPLKIFHRYHFSSQMKRMTVIAGYQPHGTSDTNHIVVVKGAPEVLRDMYKDIPAHYEDTYQKLAQAGARVLALGIAELGSVSHQQIRESRREDFEKELTFAGFVVISCPLKPDTKLLIKEIIDSSHKVTMITGDNPLTACHVANVLRFVKKTHTVLILDEPAENPENDWQWRSVDGKLTMNSEPAELVSSKRSQQIVFFSKYELCMTGAGYEYLHSKNRPFLLEVLPQVRVFARMSPKQKERVVNDLKAMGNVTLMCGDGTNDVGALKHSHVGVALLSHPYDATKKDQANKDAAAKSDDKNGHIPSNPNEQGDKKSSELPAHLRGAAKRQDAPVGSRPARAHQNMQARLEQLRKEMEEEEQAKVIKLGDASIAAPFTSKFTSIQSICHVIKQGRCTLVTTLQMFKILALNALVLAYSQSVLYLDGVKFSDSQATIQGLLLAACFLFVSRSKPLNVLSKQRPIPNIFNAYTLLTVTGQFLVHFACLVFIVQQAHIIAPRAEKIDLEAEFKPNILNSAVYVMSMALQVSTFAVNYRGRPFMESLAENKPMLFSILSSGLAVFALASNIVPELSQKFELVEMPNEFRNILVCCVVADLFLCYALDRLLNFLIGDFR